LRVSIAWNQREEQDPIRRIALRGSVDVCSAAELKAALLDALAGGKEIRVSTEGMCDVDVIGLQLLWAAKREAARRGIALVMDGEPWAGAGALLSELGMEGLEILA
jgi:STAS domain